MDTKALRQKILDLAIHGRLVPQVPADEPASVLLQRIREEKERLIKEGKIKKGKKAAKTSDTAQRENVPFEVPESWEWTTLGEIGDIVTGNTPSKDISDYYGGEIPFFKPADLDQGINTSTSKDHLTELGFEQSRQLPAKSVLVTCIGATIGKTGLISADGSCNQQINAIVPTIAILSTFLYYVCVSDYFQQEIKDNASATTLPILNKNNFAALLIPLPPLAEQRRIVAEIERWFSLIDIIESNKASLQTAVKQAKAKILDLAIHGKLVPQDPADEPAAELLRRINPKAEITSDNAQYGKVPYGWCKCKFEDVFSDISSKPYQILQSQISTKGQIPVVSQSSNFIEGYSEQNNFYKAESPIVIFGDHTRNVKYINFNFIVGADGVKIIIPLHNPKYGYYLIKYASLHIQDKGYSRHFGQIKKFSYPLPPLSEQHRIVSKIEELFAQLDRIEAEL